MSEYSIYISKISIHYATTSEHHQKCLALSLEWSSVIPFEWNSVLLLTHAIVIWKTCWSIWHRDSDFSALCRPSHYVMLICFATNLHSASRYNVPRGKSTVHTLRSHLLSTILCPTIQMTAEHQQLSLWGQKKNLEAVRRDCERKEKEKVWERISKKVLYL